MKTKLYGYQVTCFKNKKNSYIIQYCLFLMFCRSLNEFMNLVGGFLVCIIGGCSWTKDKEHTV